VGAHGSVGHGARGVVLGMDGVGPVGDLWLGPRLQVGSRTIREVGQEPEGHRDAWSQFERGDHQHEPMENHLSLCKPPMKMPNML